MKFLLLCCLLAAGSCLAGVSSNDTYSSFYNSVPDDLKDAFISYQLALAVVEVASHSKAKSNYFTDDLLTPEGLGVPEETFSVLRALNTPHGFSGHLYDLATERLGLSFDEIINLIKRIVICQGGYCYDLGDVGNNCC